MIDGVEKMGTSIPVPLALKAGRPSKVESTRRKYVPYGSWVSIFSEMKVGECIRLSGVDKKRASSARIQSISVASKTGFKFTTRTIDGVLHVWRVA